MSVRGFGVFDDVLRRFGWSRMHPIFFLLARFDILAVALGLWLAMHANGKFQQVVDHIDAANLVRHKTTDVMGAVMAFSGPA